ncbi:MAG: hypothetical protein B5M56_06425 [Desulfococcus sp. 4484_241]|nr:MAG: hypothetical protein B5M56_06425 [Desulfococcus sp. 4484_241]
MAKFGTISLEEKRRLEQPDKFMVMATKAMQFLSANKKQVIIAVCIVAAAAILVAGLHHLSVKKEEKAFGLLSEAMAKADSASSTAPGTAKTAFGDVYEKYPQTLAGKFAGLSYARQCYESKEYKTAIEVYSKVLKSVKTVPILRNIALNGLGYANEAAGNYNEAAGCFEKIIKNDDETWLGATTLFNLGVVYEKMGEKEKSRKMFERIVSDYPDSLYANVAKGKIGS